MDIDRKEPPMASEPGREMSLIEWIDRLPTKHRARTELDYLRARLATSEARVAELEAALEDMPMIDMKKGTSPCSVASPASGAGSSDIDDTTSGASGDADKTNRPEAPAAAAATDPPCLYCDDRGKPIVGGCPVCCLHSCDVPSTPPPQPVTPSPRDWPEDAQQENGNYQCRCVHCGNSFIGHKRRVVCRACAVPTPPPAKRESGGPYRVVRDGVQWMIAGPFDSGIRYIGEQIAAEDLHIANAIHASATRAAEERAEGLVEAVRSCEENLASICRTTKELDSGAYYAVAEAVRRVHLRIDAALAAYAAARGANGEPS